MTKIKNSKVSCVVLLFLLVKVDNIGKPTMTIEELNNKYCIVDDENKEIKNYQGESFKFIAAYKNADPDFLKIDSKLVVVESNVKNRFYTVMITKDKKNIFWDLTTNFFLVTSLNDYIDGPLDQDVTLLCRLGKKTEEGKTEEAKTEAQELSQSALTQFNATHYLADQDSKEVKNGEGKFAFVFVTDNN